MMVNNLKSHQGHSNPGALRIRSSIEMYYVAGKQKTRTIFILVENTYLDGEALDSVAEPFDNRS